MNLPPYRAFPVLKAGEYTLRQILHVDIKNILDLSFWDGVPAKNLDQAIGIQNRVDEEYLQGNSIHWGIADKYDNIIGVCGYYRGFEKNNGEIGFVLKETHRGQGIMLQALVSIINFGVNKISLNYIFSITRADNSSAITLLEKLKATRANHIFDNEVEYQLYKR
ncbi:GNAT family N-acetyltransferase [Mucilaginibacter phyllosphaerae]|uniref:N-acetyltransferase n=1 Tax=Mucilaginibacter phyllosphaerae TaxID=1812349 RepID=A0A4Y8AI50_9SPHI|nr:GNAT family N-acetyltransferase [Mucilaginibacter phyllosphaerae]MBB3968242.1 ribosomal-protein-alanine N-acetyltransferase [Mucilaginibacter phyllosphaerae]TEW68750.1 N-acetyltransferase [Mucilaginibacter phyllosphaerae]GGH00270.1 hypothetical protein GCM10007352_01490 [Mucilaginibacter phyllosphaerae]